MIADIILVVQIRECYAYVFCCRCSGATVLYEGTCIVDPCVIPDIYAPVCATINGQLIEYGNVHEARCAYVLQCACLFLCLFLSVCLCVCLFFRIK